MYIFLFIYLNESVLPGMDTTLCIHSNVWFGCMACVPSKKNIFYVFFLKTI